MNVKVEKQENSKVVLEFTMSKEDFEKELTKAFNQNAKYFKVPGFRNGKAPRSVVEKMYGEGVLYETVIENNVDDEYRKAIEENKLEVVSKPELDIKQIGKGKDMIYTVTFYVKPEAKLKAYKNLEIEKVDRKVKKADVEKALNDAREKNARIVTVEDRELKNNDISTIDFEGFVDGVAFEGGKGENFELTIGSGQFIPGFEEALIGMKIGDERDINVTFPEDYHAENLAGKEAMFKVKLISIKEKILPELDDEFAKETSEFDTIADLKADVTKKLEEANAERSEREFEEAVITAVAGNAKVEIPEVMVEKEVDKMVQNLQQRLQYQGLTLEQYFQFTGTDEEKMREYMRTNAQTKVKVDLVLEAIEKAENVEATEEEIRAKAVEVAKMYAASEDEKMVDLLMQSQQAALRADVITNKTMKLLLENNK